VQRRRRNASDVLGPIVELEGLLVFGGLGILAYWIATGGAKAFFCPGGGGICSLFPKQTGLLAPLPGVGTGVSGSYGTTPPGLPSLPAGYNPTIPSGDLVVMTSSGPQTFGPSGLVPGTGQSVTDLRNIGLSDSDISGLIAQYFSNPGAYTADDGGASGSW
jgi:hypothetical protein